jgi:Ca2+:H+ antiporter
VKLFVYVRSRERMSAYLMHEHLLTLNTKHVVYSAQISALVSVSFGNVVELVISLAALKAGKMRLIQNTLVGSILSNLLLVLGSAFAAGGIRYKEQTILLAVSEANSDLLAVSAFGFAMPAIFDVAMSSLDSSAQQSAGEKMSLITAICLFSIYCLFLTYQLSTHKHLFEGRANDHPDERTGYGGSDLGEEEDHAEPAALPVAVTILVVSILVVAGLSEYLVDSVDEFASRSGLSTTGVAVVLLPICGNAIEHTAAVIVAYHGKIDLAIGIACGSVSQIALFVAPVMVILSWLLPGSRLTLNFDIFSTASIVFSVLVANATLRDTKSNWFEGAVLVISYIILCAAFFLMP